MIYTYDTPFGTVQVSEAEGALLQAEDWITQRPMSAGNLSHIMPIARRVRAEVEMRARREHQPCYHWLGADAD